MKNKHVGNTQPVHMNPATLWLSWYKAKHEKKKIYEKKNLLKWDINEMILQNQICLSKK